MWVVKIGGSLWDSDCLQAWVDQLAALSVPVVLVPGGGPFADQVRLTQRRWHFDDDCAHRMALLAMEQMAHMLCALHPRLRPMAESAGIRSAIDEGRVPVWLPSQMVMRDQRLPASWTVTSDSLALWLATRLGARGLLLVKSAPLAGAAGELRGLQQSGLVDAAFDGFCAISDCPVWLINRENADDLCAVLQGAAESALRVAC